MLIGLSGLAGSGKDTTASTIIKNYGFVGIAFADPIKRIVKELYNFSDEQLWGESQQRSIIDERYGISPRKALQNFGDAGRGSYEKTWIDNTINASNKIQLGGYSYTATNGLILDYRAPSKSVIISDCRFENELKNIKAAGGKLIRVLRNGAGLKGEEGQHESELEQVNIPDTYFDYIINNSAKLIMLKLNIKTIMRKLECERTMKMNKLCKKY